MQSSRRQGGRKREREKKERKTERDGKNGLNSKSINIFSILPPETPTVIPNLKNDKNKETIFGQKIHFRRIFFLLRKLQEPD